jgi:DNA-binding LacI/PurR family transcriptional regulator
MDGAIENSPVVGVVPKKPIKLADVARVAGVSKTTASHALSGKGWVSAHTRQSVQRVAQELGFEADPLARLLSNGRCDKTIGFYTLDLDLSGRTRQLQLIQAELNDRGFSVPIYAYGYRGGHDLENQIELMTSLLAQRPRAIVCNISGVRHEVLQQLQGFVDDGGAAVCYGYSEHAPVQCDQVIYDQQGSYYQAARHLIHLGHRTLGLFNVGQRVPHGSSLEGFSSALQEANVSVKDEWLFPNDGTKRYEEDGALLAERFLALKERPTAMVIANDYAATAFIATVVRAGVRVPENLSVVGHDDDAIAPYAVVPLTTVSSPVENVSERVVEMLHERLTGDYQGVPRHVGIEGTVVVRSSTAPCPNEDRL